MKLNSSELSNNNSRNLRQSYTQTINRYILFSVNCFLFCIFFNSLSVKAQPSGGPYGPIRQTYDLPKITGQIYYVAPDGKADASGHSLGDPTTLETAIERVKTGDAIVMRGGTYR